MGVFLTPKPSFPDFGVFDPCKGQTDSQNHTKNPCGWALAGRHVDHPWGATFRHGLLESR